MPSLPLCSAVSEPVPSIVKSPEDTRSAALSPSAFSLFSPSTVRLRLESPTSIALSAPEAMFISFIVMFASASPSVETVVLLSKGEVDSKKIRVEFSLEDMDMSEFQDGATYPQIKEYVLENTGLKVSNLYISQIKRKCGIEVGKNYNLPKSEDSRQPQCPPEKEKAIREAFKYFGMI